MLTVMYLDFPFVKIQSLTKLSAQASEGRLRLLELIVKAADTILTKEIHRKVQGCCEWIQSLAGLAQISPESGAGVR